MKKTRFEKSWSTRNVPDDLWPELLSRLPVKSLLRFRCVSRSWQLLIDDPDFARLHLTRFTNNRLQSRLFVIQGKSGREECVVRCSEDFRITSTLGKPQIDPHSVDNWGIVSFTDGLFMVKLYSYRVSSNLMLWNPSIRKTLILPRPPPIPNQFDNLEFGLGFDPLIRDYKYVSIIRDGGNCGVNFVAVYTLGTNSWKTIDCYGEWCSTWRQYFIYPYGLRSLCLRGVLYALATNLPTRPHRCILFSFDLSNEVFASTRFPVEDDPSLGWCYHTRALIMMNDGDSLALVDLSETKGSIWVMENLGADFKSLIWTQRYTFPTMIPQNDIRNLGSDILYLNKNGEMLLNWDDRVTSYNLETDKENIILNNIVLKGPSRTPPYIESLILHQAVQ